jgi:hypothetical protein
MGSGMTPALEAIHWNSLREGLSEYVLPSNVRCADLDA